LTRPPSRRFWLAVIFAGAAARLWLWWISIGSNDVTYSYRYGQSIVESGLAATYTNIQPFNHPPLMGLYAAQAWWWSDENLWRFAQLIKLPGLAGEALTLWALWRFAGPKASAAYAWLPAAILISRQYRLSLRRAGTDGGHRLRPATLLSFGTAPGRGS
jgi:hypothetical protein